MMFPNDLRLVQERLSLCIRVMAQGASLDDDEIAQRLVSEGTPAIDAELLTSLVPSAFARAFLLLMELDTTATQALIYDSKQQSHYIDLTQQAYFVKAYEVARQIVQFGYTEEIPKSTLQAIVERSAEMNAVHNALQHEKSLKGGVLGPPVLLRVTLEELQSWRSS